MTGVVGLILGFLLDQFLPMLKSMEQGNIEAILSIIDKTSLKVIIYPIFEGIFWGGFFFNSII